MHGLGHEGIQLGPNQTQALSMVTLCWPFTRRHGEPSQPPLPPQSHAVCKRLWPKPEAPEFSSDRPLASQHQNPHTGGMPAPLICMCPLVSDATPSSATLSAAEHHHPSCLFPAKHTPPPTRHHLIPSLPFLLAFCLSPGRNPSTPGVRTLHCLLLKHCPYAVSSAVSMAVQPWRYYS